MTIAKAGMNPATTELFHSRLTSLPSREKDVMEKGAKARVAAFLHLFATYQPGCYNL